MSHYLARLVERARGTAPRVEPIIASRFAASPGGFAMEDASHETPSEPGPVARVRSEPIPNSAEPTEIPLEAEGEKLLLPQFQKEAGPMESTENHAIAIERTDATTSNTQRGRRSRAVRERARASVSSSLSGSLRDEPRNEAPIVRVTIGRIDVRANPQPMSAPRKPARPAEPKLTLDAYLKSRKEGAR